VSTVEIDEPAGTHLNVSDTVTLDDVASDERSASSGRDREQPERRRNRSTALGETELPAVGLEREPHDQTEGDH